jgi:hypothetical protein
LAFFIIINSSVLAGKYSVKPVSNFSANFLVTVKKLDSSIEMSKPAVARASSGTKICSCQILNLQSANYVHRNVAVFAEKTNSGNSSANYKIAKQVIEKEKKHLRELFYDRMEVLHTVAETTDCKSLYNKLKGSDQSLVIYDILDADIKR